jgi:hypothetical protein
MQIATGAAPSPAPFKANLGVAARFWEPWRLGYNTVLAAVAGTWVIATWPHFRWAIRLIPFLQLMVLALLANVCYTTAYLVDLPLQCSSFATAGDVRGGFCGCSERFSRWFWNGIGLATRFTPTSTSFGRASSRRRCPPHANEAADRLRSFAHKPRSGRLAVPSPRCVPCGANLRQSDCDGEA